MERRLILEVVDPRFPKAGGIDTCIRGLVKYAPADVSLSIAGIDSVGDLTLGEWTAISIDGRAVDFLPLAQSDPKKVKPRVPHALKLIAGLRAHRSRLDGFDVYQEHRLTVGYAARRIFKNATHVQFVHNDGEDNLRAGSESYFTRAERLYRYLERSAVVGSSDVVVFNARGADRLAAFGSNVRFSPTWYDDDVFYPADSGPARSSRTKGLMVGRLDPAKDPLLALQAIAQCSAEVTLTLVGSGRLEVAVVEEIERLGLSSRVEMAGLVPKDRVGALMREHEFLVMSSHYEGFPRTVVEGLACGLPVATTHGGEPNGLVVSGVNGWRIDTREPADLAQAIGHLSDVDRDACVSSVRDLAATTLVPRVLGR